MSPVNGAFVFISIWIALWSFHTVGDIRCQTWELWQGTSEDPLQSEHMRPLDLYGTLTFHEPIGVVSGRSANINLWYPHISGAHRCDQ